MGLTIRFGPVVNGICNSCRKFLSILISIVFFPSRNSIDHTQIIGMLCFSGGLAMRWGVKKNKKNPQLYLQSGIGSAGIHPDLSFEPDGGEEQIDQY